MLQTLAQNLIQEAEGYTAQEAAYKQQVMDENKGMLLASVVQFSKQLPPPPQEYYGNQGALNYYYTTHLFDYYPFEDSRMVATPLAAPRIRQYAAEIYYLQPDAAAKLADELLTKARVNPVTYHCFFDNLEAILGTSLRRLTFNLFCKSKPEVESLPSKPRAITVSASAPIVR